MRVSGEFCLQFGHPRSVETHGHAGGACSVTQFPQHSAPLFLILLIPVRTEQNHIRELMALTPKNPVCGNLLPDVSDL